MRHLVYCCIWVSKVGGLVYDLQSAWSGKCLAVLLYMFGRYLDDESVKLWAC